MVQTLDGAFLAGFVLGFFFGLALLHLAGQLIGLYRESRT